LRKTVFDVHCHLFNIIDVPLWETISGAMRMHTLIGLASILKGEQITKEHRYFLRFFERSTETNLIWFANQIIDAVHGSLEMNEFLGSPTEIVITPLIMDFDTHIEDLPCMIGDECVESQYTRLDHAIAQCRTALSQASMPVRTLPFMGLALDKLNNNDPSQFLKKFQNWWKLNGITPEERKLPWDKMPQKAIGIKLYPALGFSPYPSTQDKGRYLEFYHWCVENDIPITAHCQPGAFDPDNPGGANQNSSPRYWQQVLGTNGLQSLRINFAHFGGGGNIPSVLDETGALSIENETSIIIRMLREYPNAYADLAAINFRDRSISEGFARLLTQDLHEDHGSKYSLCDKLIWGSDVPMIIRSPQYQRESSEQKPEIGYSYCLQYFKRTINKVRSIESGMPDSLSQAKQKQVMQGILSRNPERFLSGK
jgi:predicted TIM-barrel fold metal-dependent hydrolase